MSKAVRIPSRGLGGPGGYPRLIVQHPPVSTAAAVRPRRIPFGIWAVALLRVVDAAAIAAIAVGWRAFPMPWLPGPLTDPRLIAVVGLGWAGAAVAGVAGLLLLRSWGWVLTMVMVGVGLAFSLLRWAAGTPDDPELLLLVITAFYLNQRSARELAEVPHPVLRA